MEKVIKPAKLVLITGVIGIAAVLITIVSDFILIGRASSAYSFLKLGTESMAGLAPWRITVGTFLGIIVLPFQITGLTSVYYGLKPAGRYRALLVLVTTSHAMIIAVAFHISYAYIAGGWKLFYEMGGSDIVAAEMLKKFDYYWEITLIVMGVEVLFGSFYYILTIIKYNTLYPKWMALLNPLGVLVYVFLSVLVLPSPIGGYIAPAFLNLSTLVFLILSTSIVYRKLKTNED